MSPRLLAQMVEVSGMSCIVLTRCLAAVRLRGRRKKEGRSYNSSAHMIITKTECMSTWDGKQKKGKTWLTHYRSGSEKKCAKGMAAGHLEKGISNEPSRSAAAAFRRRKRCERGTTTEKRLGPHHKPRSATRRTTVCDRGYTKHLVDRGDTRHAPS